MLPEQQDRIMGYFIEEAKDHLNTIEQGLINLQATIEDPELVNELFRAAHSVKGGAAMLGLTSIQQTAHRLEDSFKIFKENRVQVDQQLESLFLRVFDTLKELLDLLSNSFSLPENVAGPKLVEIEPVFEELHHHLQSLLGKGQESPSRVIKEPVLVGSAGVSVTEKQKGSGRVTDDETMTGEDSAMQLLFQSDVPRFLREMLQVFKTPESEKSRRELTNYCQGLKTAGESFELKHWTGLLDAVEKAINYGENSYRSLAPIIIKDIKQAQELVLANRESEIVVGEGLKALLPPQPPEVDNWEELLSLASGDDFLLGGEETADLFDWGSEEESSQVNASRKVPTEVVDEVDHLWGSDWGSMADSDFTEHGDGGEELNVSGHPEKRGPEVGMAELNSLADLFEEMPDLGDSWDDGDSSQVVDLVSDHSPLSEFSGSDDFTDLLFSTGEETDESSSDDDELNTLLGEGGEGEQDLLSLDDESLSLASDQLVKESVIADEESFDLDSLEDFVDNKDSSVSEQATENLKNLFGEIETVESDLSGSLAGLSRKSVQETPEDVPMSDEDFGDLFGLGSESESPEIPEVSAAVSESFLSDFEGSEGEKETGETAAEDLGSLFGFDDLNLLEESPQPSQPVLSEESLDLEALFNDVTQEVTAVSDEQKTFIQGIETESTEAESEGDLEALFGLTPDEEEVLPPSMELSDSDFEGLEGIGETGDYEHLDLDDLLGETGTVSVSEQEDYESLDLDDLLGETGTVSEEITESLEGEEIEPEMATIAAEFSGKSEEVTPLLDLDFAVEFPEELAEEKVPENEEDLLAELEALTEIQASLQDSQDISLDGMDDLLESVDAGTVLSLTPVALLPEENLSPQEVEQLLEGIDLSVLEIDYDPFEDLQALLQEQKSPAVTEELDESKADVVDWGGLEDLLEPMEASETTVSTPSPKASREKIDFSDMNALLPEGPPGRNVRPVVKAGRSSEQTMKVPVKQLDNLSNLMGELVVNRNSLEQDQERMRQFLENLLHQVSLLSDVSQRMQDFYERSLLEIALLANRQGHRSPWHGNDENAQGGGTWRPEEMDRFTPFHSLAQEIIELIVRVRESAADLEFLVDEAEGVTRQLRQVTTQLQEGLTKARMMPFSTTTDRLARPVRDIPLKLGKQAQLEVEGRDILMDKMLQEQLYDPMTHLVNNAITHGIETPEVRVAAGKNPAGKITIRAFHQGNQTVISVADDGAGIDPEVVKAKAIKKGLLTPAQAKKMSRSEVYDLLFMAGFTTKDQADDFSGRGVGMDVVRTNLTEIRGAISIDSTIGKGTVFTIRLPLVLSISKALCCISDRARIAFPMDGVEDMFDVPREHVQVGPDGEQLIEWRGSLLPFRHLRELLKYHRHLGRASIYGGATSEEDLISVVVLRSAGNFLAVQVDQVSTEQEIVIKQLEGPVPKPVGIAGATVLGDGRIVAIADVLELIDLATKGLGGEEALPGGFTPEPVEVMLPSDEPTVLIVDDSITVRSLLSITFEKSGYRVEQARDGKEAWEKMKSGLPCDLVFCDIEMPRMDGLELLSRMQKDPSLCNLPIAMLTSRGADRHKQMAYSLGARGYFTKPYLEEHLLDAASRMLKGEVVAPATTG